MAVYKGISPVLYVMFASLDTFSAGVKLGYEGEAPDVGTGYGSQPFCGASFSVHPSSFRTGGYINGDEIREGVCTVALRSWNCDTGEKCATAEALTQMTAEALATFRTEAQSRFGGVLLSLTADSTPAPVRVTGQGAVWEQRFRFRVRVSAAHTGAVVPATAAEEQSDCTETT